MATFRSRYLFFSTSPRNPKLIPGILGVIKDNNLNNQPYNEQLQIDFYKAYAASDVGIRGANTSKDQAFAGRDKLTRAPQALGFLLVRQGKKLTITNAGNLLMNPNLFEDVLLHQVLKFQLPSPLHRESEDNKGKFKIKPFLEILRLINELGYLTYQELEIFGMSLTDYRNFDDTVDKIKQFREDRKKVRKNNRSLKKFAADVKWKTYIEKYADVIAMSDFKTRESNTEDIKSFMKKKLSNLGDYTDSIFRTLRETGLFVMTEGKSISISPSRKDEVDYILKRIDRNPLPVETNRDKFDSYMFDPEQPILLADNKRQLEKQLTEGNEEYQANADVYALKSAVSSMRKTQRENKVQQQVIKLKERDPEDIDDILDLYDKIKNHDVADAPTMMEWNTWRAMTMIDHGDIKGSFRPDDNGMPISTAGGNKGDIVGDYGDFNLLVEVTISTGKKQYDMESEPVTRHVGEMQASSGKPTFGIFVAVKLNDNVVSHFYTTNLLNMTVYNGHVDVIPMSLDNFIAFFKKATHKVLTEKALLSIHEYSSKAAKRTMIKDGTEKDWHNSVLAYMDKVTM